MTIRQGKIYANTKLNLATTKYILEEGMALVKVNRGEFGLIFSWFSFRIIERELQRTFFQLGHIEGNRPQILVKSTLLRLIKLDFDLTIRIFVTHFRRKR